MDPEEFREYLKHPLHFPDEFKSWVGDWFATNIPKIPISQVYGFKVHSVKTAPPISAEESTSSTSYTDLATVGPTLSSLANGFYLVLFGADVWVDPTNVKYMGVSIDGAAVDPSTEAAMEVGNSGRVFLADLSQGNHQHTLQAKYRVASGTQSFADRWLSVLKVAT